MFDEAQDFEMVDVPVLICLSLFCDDILPIWPLTCSDDILNEDSLSCVQLQVDRKRVVTAKLHSLYFRLFQRAQSNHDDIVALFDGMEELSQKLFGDTVPSVSSTDKAQRIENLYGVSRPSVVNVHPPNVVSTKGSGSRSGKRIASAIEKAIILQNKPKRRCAKCRELGHHDARNCGREKGKSKM
ncbi:hypothetical protein SASPL_108251 [Salvia splendens]|uniref:Uncharacterized protein n=1 Tax=Salvia splendens TaxID=180675 RepID=A0A8X8YEE3_SALSN|nr:hypothetical protein SASPL_108251 [Salvia splendens]